MGEAPEPGEIDPYRVELLPLIGIDLGSFEDFNDDIASSLEKAQIRATQEGILFPILAVVSCDDGIFKEGTDGTEGRLIINSCDLHARTWIECISSPSPFVGTSGNVYLVNERFYTFPDTSRQPPDSEEEGGGGGGPRLPKPRSPEGSPSISQKSN